MLNEVENNLNLNNERCLEENILDHNELSDFCKHQYVKRPVTIERIMLFGPNYTVCAMVRIDINIEKKTLEQAIDALTWKHPLLRCRVELDEGGKIKKSYFTNQSVGDIEIISKLKTSRDDWKILISHELTRPFDRLRGPLVKFGMLTDEKSTDIIVMAQHSVCDGLALIYLIQDLLYQLENPNKKNLMLYPDEISKEMIPKSLSNNKIINFLLSIINRKWRKQNISFSQADFEKLNQSYWSSYDPFIVDWFFSEVITNKIITKARAHNVTVQSLVSSALLLSQYELQKDFKPYFPRFGMPINLRDKLRKNMQGVFGLYAGATIVNMNHIRKVDFWEVTRIYHKKLQNAISEANTYRFMMLNDLDPSLFDAIYFVRQNILNNPLVLMLANRIKWIGVTFGSMISNLGRIPLKCMYKSFQVESVYCPILQDPRIEKYLGISTLAGKMFLVFTCDRNTISEELIEKIKRRMTEIILKNVE